MNAASHIPVEGPDFVGVGVQKCGTSWIGNILAQHPQVLLEKKEISFFVRHFHRGYGWYHHFFEGKNGRKAGEISVNYWLSPRPNPTRKEYYPHWNPRRWLFFWRAYPSARDELKAHYPGIQIFAIFRNPADRAWSHYWFWRNRKERFGKRIVSFETMFRDDGRWIHTQGNYADTFAHWREAFPDMGIFFYDDLKTDPAQLARQVYQFVGVDDTFEPVLTERVNPGKYEPMPGETREFLIEAYRDQIQRFSVLTGRDLSHWLSLK